MFPGLNNVKAIIVIPAFNESKVIFKVLKSLPKKIKGISELDVVVVNDGSTDRTGVEVERAGIKIIDHSLNRGVGAATKTGFVYAQRKKADLVVTFDGDGQHYSADVERVVKPVIEGRADLVIGSRLLSKQKMPFDRLIINWLANFATLALFGIFSSDSQSGLRAFSKKALEKLDFRSDRMEFSSEILSEAKKHDLVIKEVPTRAIYTDYSRKKGQSNLNAFSIFIRFMVRLLR